MNICIVDRGAKIPVSKYGGTERVIWGLGKELHRMGHKVTYLVPSGSSSDFARVLVYDPSKDLEEQIPQDIDVVHMNWEPKNEISRPFVVTMHGNPAPTDPLHPNTIFISKNQAARHNSDIFVHNGLLWEDYPSPNLKLKREGFHFLGKASWKIKNAVGAMDIAKMTNSGLDIIGGEKWTGRNIKSALPHLFNNKIKFHGLLDDAEKSKVMQRSKGLIFPVLWHEPFGLAVIESLYSGCAVFGSANGSLPELITSEVGFTGDSKKAIAEAILSFEYQPQRCHEYAVEHFSARQMTESYLQFYERVASGEQLNSEAPKYNPERNQVPEFQ